MPPPRLARLGRANAGSRAIGKRLVDRGRRGTTAVTWSVLRRYEEFMADNPAIANDRTRALKQFTGLLVAERKPNGTPRRNIRTVTRYVEIIKRLNVTPARLAEVRREVERTALSAGLRAEAREVRPARENVVLPRRTLSRPATYPAQKIEYKVACYLMLVTGARVAHLGRISKIRYNLRGVTIQWGDRKIRPSMNTSVMYPYEWGLPPSDDVREVTTGPQWERVKTEMLRPTFGQRVNVYIRAVCGAAGVRAFTSRLYRCRYSSIALDAYRRGKLTEEQFAIMLDHTPEVSGIKYLLPGPAADLLY